MRYFLVLSLVVLAASALAQQGAGGYGQGAAPGSGGGLGGGGGGRFSANESILNQPSPDNDRQDEEFWTTKSAVLTPGDRVEFTFKVKKGETIMAGATSDAFDPALVVEDDKGNKLKEVDDRVEGDQSPFVVFQFPNDGTYKLKVICYKPVAGGKFTLKTRLFQPLDAKLEKMKHAVPAGKGSDNGRFWLKLEAKKGSIYDLRQLRGERQEYLQLKRILGPTGVQESDFEMIYTDDSTPVFKALSSSDYYFEYICYSKEATSNYREVKPVVLKAAEAQNIKLENGELAIFEISVAKDQIIRTDFAGQSLSARFTGPVVSNSIVRESDSAYGNSISHAWYRIFVDDENRVVRVFHEPGTARLVIRSNHSSTQEIKVTNTDSLPTWEPGNPIKGTIEVGEARLMLIKSSKSELMRVFAGATHFLPRLEIFLLSGDLANSLINRKTKVCADDLYFPDAGTYIVRFSCEGNGGSGEFEMKRDQVTASTYTLGSVGAIKFEGGKFGLFSADLIAGKRYEVVIDNAALGTRVDLLDDDGQFLVSQSLRFDNIVVHYFVPTKSGRHRLWLRGSTGERKFKLQLHVPPTIGG